METGRRLGFETGADVDSGVTSHLTSFAQSWSVYVALERRAALTDGDEVGALRELRPDSELRGEVKRVESEAGAENMEL